MISIHHLFILISITICIQTSSIHADYADISEYLTFGEPRIPDGRITAMYSLDDTPTGNTRPYIEVDVTARTINGTEADGFFEVIILRDVSLETLQFKDPNFPAFSKQFCCTQEIYDATKESGGYPGCSESEIGTLLIDDSKLKHESKQIKFGNAQGGKTTEVKVQNMQFFVNTTGEHILILSNCDQTLGAIFIDGESKWVNPYGFLPGRLYGYLEFYGYMSIVYLVIGLIWFIFNAYYWTEVVMVQNCITVVLGMCMIEMTVWYFDYKSFNDTGRRNIGTVVVGIMITVSRQTLSRMLVLGVSLGWGVVRPTLGKNKLRLALLGIVYWLCETAFELATRYSQTAGSIYDRIRMFLALPVSVLNTIFYWWIFIALYRIIAQLEARRQESKLHLYRRFTKVLIFSLIVTIVFAIYQMYYWYSQSYFLHWSQLWLLDVGFPFIVYTVILLAIAFLWRPSQNSRRYAYAEVARGTEDDGEYGDLEMEEGGNTTAKPNHDPLGLGIEDDSEDDVGPPVAGRFTVEEEHEHMHQQDPLDDMVGTSQPMTKLA